MAWTPDLTELKADLTTLGQVKGHVQQAISEVYEITRRFCETLNRELGDPDAFQISEVGGRDVLTPILFGGSEWSITPRVEAEALRRGSPVPPWVFPSTRGTPLDSANVRHAYGRWLPKGDKAAVDSLDDSAPKRSGDRVVTSAASKAASATECPEPRLPQPPENGAVVAVLENGGLYRHYERRAA